VSRAAVFPFGADLRELVRQFDQLHGPGRAGDLSVHPEESWAEVLATLPPKVLPCACDLLLARARLCLPREVGRALRLAEIVRQTVERYAPEVPEELYLGTQTQARALEALAYLCANQLRCAARVLATTRRLATPEPADPLVALDVHLAEAVFAWAARDSEHCERVLFAGLHLAIDIDDPPWDGALCLGLIWVLRRRGSTLHADALATRVTHLSSEILGAAPYDLVGLLTLADSYRRPH